LPFSEAENPVKLTKIETKEWREEIRMYFEEGKILWH